MIENDEEKRFHRVSQAITESLEMRVMFYENALIAVQGLFRASESVNETEFKDFIKALMIYERFPGFREIGFAARVKAKGPTDVYPVIYSQSRQELVADQYRKDLFVDSLRKKAMLEAADSGEPVASNHIKELASRPTPETEFFIFAPIYKSGKPLQNANQRRMALQGFVYSRLNLQDLFKSVSSDLQNENPRLGISIFSDPDRLPENLLYTSVASDSLINGLDIPRERVHTIEVGGQKWTVVINSLPGFDVRSAKKFPLYLLAMGVAISFLIFMTLRFGDRMHEQLKTDLDRRIASEKEILKARRLAEEANRAKSRFLANISHEIRTPLGVITGYTELALKKLKANHEVYRYLKTIERNGEQLGTLIGEVLDLSKIEANKLEIERVRFSLFDLLNDVVTSSKLKAQKKNVRLKLKKSSHLPEFILSDPTKLRQILINLVGNAIKFTPQGEVCLSVRMVSSPEIGAPLELEFSVTDTGIGLTEEQKRGLFKPFAQADNSTTRKYGGTGLGLYLSREMAHALGGEVSLKVSRPGEGSCFALNVRCGPFEGFFQRKEVSPAPPQATPVYRGKDILGGKRILIAEDSEDIQALLRLYLEDEGAWVDVANDGVEAVEKAVAQDYDLILMDIQMPEMDGHHATERLRRIGYNKPIIALTAHAFKEEQDRALEMGFTRYLTKPINRAHLVEGVYKETHPTI